MSYERTYENTRETVQLSEEAEQLAPIPTRTPMEVLVDLTLSSVISHGIGMAVHTEAASTVTDTAEAVYDTSLRDKQLRHEKTVAKQW